MEDNLNLVSMTLPHLREIRKSSMGETYQYLHELSKGKSIENLKEVVSSGTPLTVFDENLRLMLIDRLRWESEVVNILLSQDDYQIKRILNCKWFFQNLSSEFCTTQILPFVSQSVRCKIINRLSKHLNNTAEAEKYFAFIRDNYDCARANYLLPRCSPQFILNHFEKNKITLKIQERVVFNICKKYPDTGIKLLSSLLDVENREDWIYPCEKVLLYLSGNYPDLMVPFLIKHRPKIPLNVFGKRLTKKFATKLRDQLFPDFVRKLIFKENYLTDVLSLEEKKKFIATIVRCEEEELSSWNWRKSEDSICALLKKVPLEYRPGLVEGAFKEVYGSNFSDASKFWRSAILELLPTEARQPYAGKLEGFLRGSPSEFQNNVDLTSFSSDMPEEILYLHDTSTGFQKLKELLQKAPLVRCRESIVCHMVKNCSISNDVKALEGVVEFVCRRHRNDDPSLVLNFMRTIFENFTATALNSTIYEKLEDLAYFLTLKGHTCNTCRERHIYYRLENGMDAEDLVEKLFRSGISDRFHHGAFLEDLRSKHSRAVVLALCKKASDLIREKSAGAPLSNDLENTLSGVLVTCSEFNKQNKREKIYLREIPGLSEILRRKLRECFGDAGGESWALDIWDRYHGDLTNSYYKARHLLYALKRNPSLPETHMQGILNILFSDYFRVYNALVKFFTLSVSFLGKTDQLKEIILKEFKNGAPIQRRKNALLLYSRVCTFEEFSKAIDEYLPRGEKIQGRSEGGFDEIQISIPPLIKNVIPRWRNLQTILKFFFGDFLKSALTSFFSCCHHTRCDLVIPFLKQQLNEVPQRVSYKKEIIRLILQVSDRRGRLEFCLREWTESSHYSLRVILLREMGKYFLDQPSRESFQLLEKFILESDDIIIKARPDLVEVPEEYWSDYVSALWRFSEGIDSHSRRRFREEFLWSLNLKTVAVISGDLWESIIKKELFAPSPEIDVQRLTVWYLAADPQAVHARVSMVLELLKTQKAKVEAFDDFLEVLTEESETRPGHYADVLTILLENWPSCPLGALYKRRVLLTYHNFYQRAVKTIPDKGSVPGEFGKRLRVFFEDIGDLKHLIPIYSETLQKLLYSLKIREAILVARELVAGSKDRTLAVLTLMSLPAGAVHPYRTKEEVFSQDGVHDWKVMEEIFRHFESFDDDVVQIYFRAKFGFPLAQPAFQ